MYCMHVLFVLYNFLLYFLTLEFYPRVFLFQFAQTASIDIDNVFVNSLYNADIQQ